MVTMNINMYSFFLLYYFVSLKWTILSESNEYNECNIIQTKIRRGKIDIKINDATWIINK